MLPILLLVACHLGDVNVKTTCDDLPGGCDDLDRDGFVAPDDCDPSNGAINPNATDVAGDGIDQNCDDVDGIAGQSQDDADHDGFGAADDCNDGNGAINPDATDLSGDAVDQNCDGVDGVDADGDGFAASWSAGDDCDDDNTAIHPGLADVDADGVDQNCDGVDGPIGPAEFLGDLTLTTDADLSWFCGHYGTVRGSLTLGTQITDLSKLDCLQSVGGNLTGSLPAVSALRFVALTEVGGDLHLVAVNATSLFVPELTETGGNLELATDLLETMNFPSLLRVGGMLSLAGVSFQDVNATGLAEVGSLNLQFYSDAAMNFPALTTVEQNFSATVASTDATVSADFTALTEVGNQLYVYADIENLSFPVLDSATSIYVYDSGASRMNVNLPLLYTLSDASFSGIGKLSMPKLSTLGSLELANGTTALDVRALKSLSGDLTIYNSSLSDFGDFGALQVIDGSLLINNNLSLSDVSELYNVTKVDFLSFSYNSPITDSDGQSLARALGLGSNVYIYGNGL